ncbi:MAG: hypothetical protein IBJ07_12245 [Rhizobiaceae bacterium]|nr:hypothetical protein [Rhizobiaceae bacterium]
MPTEFDDSLHYGVFTTSPTLTSNTGKMVRQSELTLAALRAAGVFDNMVDGMTPPATDKLWLDKNLDPAVLKEWDATGSAWEPMTFDRLFGRAVVTPLAAPTGTADALIVAQPSPFMNNRLYSLTPAADNTGAATVQVTGVGTYPIRYIDGTDLEAKELSAGNAALLLFTGAAFAVLNKVAPIHIAVAAAEDAASRAETAADAAEAVLDALNFPPITVADAGNPLVVNPAGDGYIVGGFPVPPGVSVSTRSALAALDTSENSFRFLTEPGREGPFVLREGDYTAAVTADVAEGVFVAADDAPASEKVWARVDTTFLHPLMFGAEGQSDCTQAFLDCLAAADYLGKPMHILDRSLSYPVQAGTNWAAAGRSILGVGHPIIEAIGTGPIFKCDVGAATGANMSGMTIKSLILKGNSATIDGLYMRGMVHADIDDIEVRNVRAAISPGVTPYSAAFNINFAVASVFKDLQYRPDTFGQTYKADRGIWLNHSSEGYFTADCTFINVRMEGGISQGINIERAAGNVFLGGTSEGCGTGIDIQDSNTNQRNSFKSLWCEANTYADLVGRGFLNSFDACNFQSAGSLGTVNLPTGKAFRFRDCYVRWANLQSPSANTIFDGCVFSDNASLGITGIGSYRTFGCVKTNTSGVITSTMTDV